MKSNRSIRRLSLLGYLILGSLAAYSTAGQSLADVPAESKQVVPAGAAPTSSSSASTPNPSVVRSKRPQPAPGYILNSEGEWVYPVPNCASEEKTIIVPRWLTRVPYFAAFCVHGLRSSILKVDIGTSLIAHEEHRSGDAANHIQVYYSLSHIEIPPNTKQVVWAMCGGGGVTLENGTRVMPAHRLPRNISQKLSQQLDILMRIDKDLSDSEEVLKALLLTAGGEASRSAAIQEKRVRDLDTALTDMAGLLRDTVINENRMLLKHNQTVLDTANGAQGMGGNPVPPNGKPQSDPPRNPANQVSKPRRPIWH